MERADSFASLPGEDILTDWVDEMRRAHTRGRNVAGITTNKLSGNVAFFFLTPMLYFHSKTKEGALTVRKVSFYSQRHLLVLGSF